MVNQRDGLDEHAGNQDTREPDDILVIMKPAPALKRLMDGTGSILKAAKSILSSWYVSGDEHSNSPHIDL